MDFEYHELKSIANLRKHGISLEDAKELWLVAHVQLDAGVAEEPRSIIVGKINHRCYSCIFTMRGETVRLISARRSRSKEEKIYHEQTQKETDGQGV